MNIRVVVFILFWTGVIHAQNPVASFQSPATACLSEDIVLQNTSTSATQYTWDFCLDDIKATPVPQLHATLPTPGSFFYHSIHYVFDNGERIAFVTDISGNRLLRLDYGTSLSNAPIITNLGTLSGFSSPAAISLINHNGAWYAFVLNIFSNSIVRIQFGNGIKQPPTLSENLGNLSGQLSTPSGIRVVFAGGKYIALVVNLSSNKVNVIDFGASPANTPTTLNSVGPASFVDIYGLSVTTVSGNWYVLLGSFTASKSYLLNFGSDLTNSPTITEITGIPSGSDLEFASEGAQQYAMVRSRTDGLYRIDFGSSFGSAPTITRIGPLGLLLSESRSLAFVRDSPGWKLFTVEATNGNLYRIDFEGNCNAQMSLNNSSSQTPTGLFYKTTGSFPLELTASNGNGKSVTSATINVLNSTSSGVSIQKSVELCVGSSITFQANSTGTLTSYSWDFGDGNSTVSSGVVNHSYVSNGDYTVSLQAIEQNGCKNGATNSFSIFNAPVADFALPVTSGTVCTLQDYTFTDQTSVDLNAPVSRQWKVDNIDATTNIDLVTTFASIKTYAIELMASIPGCSNSVVKNFEVTGAGDAVDFTYAGACLGSPTIFTNATTGTPISFSWDFGDGQTSSQTSLNHQFQSVGTYQVSLQATSVSGCTNSVTRSVKITDLPQPDFYIDLPPFSCTGTPTQFHDLTPALVDGNVVLWQWNFDDGGSMSTQQSPQHTYNVAGIYNVSLHVESNFGCEATVQIPIEIVESPKANFSFGPACLNKGTQFVGTSESVISAWKWTIDNTFYGFPEPTHTFNFSGNYPVTLTVVGSNGCEGSLTKTVEIEPTPLLDFITSIACAGQVTTFTDQTTGVDLPLQWQWNFEPNAMGEDSPASYAYQAAGSKPVKMSIVTQSGCEYSLTKNVIVAPSPTASFTTSETFGAPPLAIQFSNTSLNASGYSWNFGANNAGSTESNPTFTYTQLGEYLIELTATNGAGCSDVATRSIQVLVPRYNLSLESLVIQEGLSAGAKVPVVTITNNSNVPVAETDIWVTGSSGLRVKSSVSLNLAPGTMQELTLPLEVFSREKFICVELNPTADADFTDNMRCENLMEQPVLVAPYPNPTLSVFWLDVVLAVAGDGSLKIVDSMGKIVFEKEFASLHQGMNRIEIDFSDQPPGLYVALWNMGGKQTEFRFIRQ